MSRTVLGSKNGIEFEMVIPPRLEHALRSGNLALRPTQNFIARGAEAIKGGAQERAPTGVSGGAGLRGSLGIEYYDKKTTAIIGSNLPYAAPQEFGTKPFWPPYKSASFQRWAQLKGVNAFLVARAISRRGIRPRRFLRDSWDAYRHGPLQRHANRFRLELQDAWGRL